METRRALGLNYPGLLATTLLSSNEMRIKPMSSLESVSASTPQGRFKISMTRCLSHMQKSRLSQEKLLAQGNTLSNVISLVTFLAPQEASLHLPKLPAIKPVFLLHSSSRTGLTAPLL